MPTAPDELTVLTRFGRELRAAGLGVGPGRTAEFARAAALLEPGDEVIVPDFTLGKGQNRLDRLDLIINEVAPRFR